MGQKGFLGGKKKFDPRNLTIGIIIAAISIVLAGGLFYVYQVKQSGSTSGIGRVINRPDSSGDTNQLLTFLEFSGVSLKNVKTLEIYDDSVLADGEKIKFKCNSVDFGKLSRCSNATKVTVVDVNVVDDCKGIENFGTLFTLIINDSNLSSVEEIAKCSSINWLNIENNKVRKIEELEYMPYLYYVNIKGNTIWEHRPLRNVEIVDMWDDDCIGPFGLATAYRDENSRQIYVDVWDLALRTSPKRGDQSNLTGEYALQGGYYYILDNVWADGYTWVKVGNDVWMATNEGDWTYLYE